MNVLPERLFFAVIVGVLAAATVFAGEVLVQSFPACASISLNGEDLGLKTPACLGELPEGEHQLALQLGNEIQTSIVVVEDGVSIVVRFPFGCESGWIMRDVWAVEVLPPAFTKKAPEMPDLGGIQFRKGIAGLKYAVLKPGSGEYGSRGKKVVVQYTGWFTDGKQFDSSRERLYPFEFTVGSGKVVPGWELTLPEMQVGERRIIILPPDLAYGERGRGTIPPESTLVFEIELVTVR